MRNEYVEKEPVYIKNEWNVSEDRYIESNTAESESVFATANGYIGVRGSFEEGYCNDEKTYPGVFLNGVYEYFDNNYIWCRPGFAKTSHREIKNVNPLNIKIYIDGEQVVNSNKNYLRSLDFRTGVLVRKFSFSTKKGKIIDIKFQRFAVQNDKNLYMVKIDICSEFDAEVKIQTKFNKSLFYEDKCNGEDEIYPNFVNNFKFSRENDIDIATYSTIRSNIQVACAIKDTTNCIDKKICSSNDELLNEYTYKLSKGNTISFERLIGYSSSRDEKDCRKFIVEKIAKNSKFSYDEILYESKKIIDDFWKYSDIRIDDDIIVEQGLRFSLFQVFQSAGRDGLTNISPNGLTGSQYGGQTFWDTEMYMLPVFTYGKQDIAKKLLEYRYSILDNSRKRAVEMEDQGALYSWSTISGEECSVVFEAATAQYHINADIGFAIESYFDATKDESFIVECGAEMLFEMSKCLSHRGNFIKERDGKFCINVICGPDEYNPIVDNNMYTNYLTKKMFDFTIKTRGFLSKKYPEKLKELEHKCNMDDKEFDRLAMASKMMYYPYNKKYKMYMQDDNFMYKDPINLDDIPQEKLPLLATLHPLNLWRLQICKQADLILLTFLCSELFDKKQIKKIFDYYEPKTIHDSSLSAAIHSIVACAIGRTNEAYKYLRQTTRMDLDNVNRNTGVGCHSACMGGARMLIVNGYAGLRIYNGELHFTPILDEKWKGYSFNFNYQGSLLSVSVKDNKTAYKVLEGNDIYIFHYGKKILVTKQEKWLVNK